MQPRMVLIVLACAGLAGCGADGEPSTPPPLKSANSAKMAAGADELAGNGAAREAPARVGTQARRHRAPSRSRHRSARRPAHPRRSSPSRPGTGSATERRRATRADTITAASPASPQTRTDGVLTGADAERELHLAGAAVRRYLGLLADHDPAACTEAMTIGFVEATTRRRGSDAIRTCRDDVRRAVVTPQFVRFGGGRALTDRAYVQYTSRIGATEHTDIVRMLKVDGRYLVDGDGTAEARALDA